MDNLLDLIKEKKNFEFFEAYKALIAARVQEKKDELKPQVSGEIFGEEKKSFFGKKKDEDEGESDDEESDEDDDEVKDKKKKKVDEEYIAENKLAKGAKWYPTSGKPSDKNYYAIGGDAYDGGVVLTIVANGKKVFDGIRDGEGDFVHKGKEHSLTSLLNTLAKGSGLKSADDFQRYQMKD